jgi:hypothetical protein
VIAFSWQLLFDRVPTLVNLRSRGVLPPSSSFNCVGCGDLPESSSHLFLHCKSALVVWYSVFSWLGVVLVVPPNLSSLYACLSVAAPNIKVRKGFCLVWHSVIWAMWRARNNLIFNNVSKNPLELLEDIQILSWRWSADRLNISPCLFYEWSWDPGDCFVR